MENFPYSGFTRFKTPCMYKGHLITATKVHTKAVATNCQPSADSLVKLEVFHTYFSIRVRKHVRHFIHSPPFLQLTRLMYEPLPDGGENSGEKSHSSI